MIPPLSRRDLLRSACLGVGSLALGGLGARLEAGEPGTRLPHFAPRAKRVIMLFMHGGVSAIDSFDHKPLLARDSGKPLPFAKPRVTFAKTGNLLASPWAFSQHGQSGAWVSELWPETAKRVDDICFLKSLHGTNVAHGGALLALHTGSDTFVRPSMGSWILHALGSENRDLPGFITICPTLGHGGVNNWSSAFLPGVHQGTPIGDSSIPAAQAVVSHLRNATWQPAFQRAQLDLLGDLNRGHRASRLPDDALDSRTAASELAFRMQAEAPGVLDLARESPATHALYGIDQKPTDNFGRQCLMARRLVEAGVRFVQCSHSYKWDQHSNLKGGHSANALEVDKPIAGLLADLKARGLLQDTLVVFATEFGRTPVAEGSDGRDHNPYGFTMWLAGGGVKPGFSYGATDDYGFYATEDKVHIHDFHATLLHLLGLDHERLTYRYAGRDFRLTDVSGSVVKAILA